MAKQMLHVKEMNDWVDSKKRNALHYAARYGNEAMVRLCLTTQPNKDCADYQGQTPLMLAVSVDNLVAISILIAAHVNVNATDMFGQTALHCMAKTGSMNSATRLLAVSNIELNKEDDAGLTPLDVNRVLSK